MKNCKQCNFFKEESDTKTESYGPCLRYPPVFTGVDIEDEDDYRWQQAFIPNGETFWCGEFKETS